MSRVWLDRLAEARSRPGVLLQPSLAVALACIVLACRAPEESATRAADSPNVGAPDPATAVETSDIEAAPATADMRLGAALSVRYSGVDPELGWREIQEAFVRAGCSVKIVSQTVIKDGVSYQISVEGADPISEGEAWEMLETIGGSASGAVALVTLSGSRLLGLEFRPLDARSFELNVEFKSLEGDDASSEEFAERFKLAASEIQPILEDAQARIGAGKGR